MKGRLFEVASIGARGDGIVNADGEVLHIPKVLPGERIEIADGHVLRIVTPSADRVPPPCPHYETCGGCKFQHWSDQPYAAWKRQTVIDALVARGLLAEVRPLIDAHGAGRRRVVLHVREVSGTWRAGFMQQRSHELTPIARCLVLEERLHDAAHIAAAYGPVLGPCDVAITCAGNGLDVAIKAERKATPQRLPALQALFQQQNLTRLSLNAELLFAEVKPEIEIGPARVAPPINAFLQATACGEQHLASHVLTHLKKAKAVADLFCGIGPFALRIAAGAHVHAVDSERNAIAALQVAVRHARGLKPVTTETRDLFRNPLVPSELNEFDAVVLDPPRAGAEAQVRQIARSKVKRVISVSCDAQTFARDARILVDAGFKLGEVQPVDQFKWTAHVEIVAALKR